MRIKKILWLGDSKKSLMGFPNEVRVAIGYALGFAQRGEMPSNAKPLKGLGSGVFEIVKDAQSGTYRAVYTVQLGDMLYVLHAFQKKSTRGIRTPLKERVLIEQRLKLAKVLATQSIHERGLER